MLAPIQHSPHRQPRPPAFWANLVDRFEACAGSISQRSFAEGEGVSYHTFKEQVARKRRNGAPKLNRGPSPPRIVEVQVHPESPPPPPSVSLHASFPGGALVDLPGVELLAGLLVRFAELRGY